MKILLNVLIILSIGLFLTACDTRRTVAQGRDGRVIARRNPKS